LRTHTLTAEHLLLDLGRAEVDLQSVMIDGQDRHGVTLVREGGIVVVLVRLRQGASLNEHSAHGAATVQVLSGHAEVLVRGDTISAPTGRLIAFDAQVPHEVRALEDTTLLLTLSAQPSGHAAP
jgi:quercetin dioxygenase-like cupin family protein